jgi:WD40 repeat protein
VRRIIPLLLATSCFCAAHARENPVIHIQTGKPGGPVAVSADGKYALSGSADLTMKLWSMAAGKEMRSFRGHSQPVASVAFSPDGKLGLSGSSDKTLKLWDIASGKEVRTFAGHREAVNSVAISPDGKKPCRVLRTTH